MDVDISAQTQDGHTLQQFSQLIEMRRKWLGETSIDSTSACALNVLTSLRVLTKIANPNKTKIEITDLPGLKFSFYFNGVRKCPCLRFGKARFTPPHETRVRYVSIDKNAKPYEFKFTTPKGKVIKYILVTNTENDAKRVARGIIKARAERYKGLARRAIGVLMYKACSLNPKDSVSQLVNKVADANALVAQTISQTQDRAFYNLDLFDELLYAESALKNGKSDIELSIQKSMNKIASNINRKCKDLLLFKPIETPFPELVKRRAK